MFKQRVVIVGAGIVGLCTAYALLKQGVKHVTILEQATVDHKQAESHGPSRLLRFEYGRDLFYSRMVQLSLSRWRSLEQVCGQAFFTPTGVLLLGKEDDNFSQASYNALSKLGFPIQYLTRWACRQLFPQFNTQPYTIMTYNPEGGILHASMCLHILKDMIIDLGGHIYESARVIHLFHEKQYLPIRIQLNSGDEFIAEHVVLAMGPWLHHLLGGLHLPVRLTRQYLLYFANLPISSFGLNVFPAFFADDLYGFPINTTCVDDSRGWLKAASHAPGTPVDLDELPVIEEHVIAQTIDKLLNLLPALAQAELARIDACVYDTSPDEHFILDRLPRDPRIILATGLSGHGFKFGPVLGELLSSLVCDTEPIVPMEHFQLTRFTQQ
ncbi:MAG: FAD-dependent oxidoreductase, partial [Ktedonobacteraceae bacterium]|nr:FAD-dependent oxidoreductase [Ktedonobacteraceae bacterium]